jgi:hypothetical protein
MVREPIDWDDVARLPDVNPSGPRLILSGSLEHSYSRIELEQPPLGIVRYEYWPTEVYGFWEELPIWVMTMWDKEVPFDQLWWGVNGIELIGKTLRERVDRVGRGLR